MKPYRIGGVCRRGHKLTKTTLVRFWCRNYGGYRAKCGVCDRARQRAWITSPKGKAAHRAAKLRYKLSHGIQIGRRPASICTETDCNRRVQGFGLCAKHYQRWKYATDAEWRERTKRWQREKEIRDAPQDFVALFRKFYQLKKELQL